MSERKRGRPGRPILPGERVGMSLRVTPAMKRDLEAAAAATGRSLSQEAEIRLDRSFRDDRIEAQLKEILRLLSVDKSAD